jgi:hypothetical protein
MYTYYDKNAEIHGKVEKKDWDALCEDLKNNRIRSLYFHYTDYNDLIPQDSLRCVLGGSQLKSVTLKDSSFVFKYNDKKSSLKLMIELLESQNQLEDLTIRNYRPEDLDTILENLPALITNNRCIKKLTINNQHIDSKKFALLCESFATLARPLELNFDWALTLSAENGSFLKKALELNPQITVSPKFRNYLDELTDQKVQSDLLFLLLTGAIELVGLAIIIIAFTLLNAATAGTAGILVAAVGAAIMLAPPITYAIKHCFFNAEEETSEEIFEDTLTTTRVC